MSRPTYNFQRQVPGNLGETTATVQIGPIGGANNIGGASPLTANSTTTFHLPPIGRRAIFRRLIASTVTVPADADGTILARAMRYNASTDSATAVSADLDLEALVTREATAALQLSSATDATLIFGASDTVAINVVNNSAAIDTQPDNLNFTVEFILLD